ncbi:MAG: hypothetical protein HUJ62_06425, partial [Streptococcus gallolyticus]|nr:hypothetical protein [Streptococcus gallolyticus]
MTIAEFLKILVKKWYILVFFPLVVCIAAAVYLWGFMPDEYTASTNIYVLTKITNEYKEGSSTNATGEANTNITISQQLA